MEATLNININQLGITKLHMHVFHCKAFIHSVKSLLILIKKCSINNSQVKVTYESLNTS